MFSDDLAAVVAYWQWNWSCTVQVVSMTLLMRSDTIRCLVMTLSLL